MSYIRSPYPLKHVKGVSEMYVFGDSNDNISQWGYSDADMVEMLIKNWKTDDVVFKEWFVKTLASRLKVVLRDEPLEFMGEEYNRIDKEIREKMQKKFDKFIKKNKIRLEGGEDGEGRDKQGSFPKI